MEVGGMMPELHEVGGGWLYCGKVRLNIRRVGNVLRFPVKEPWLRASCGESVDIPISEFLELISEMTRQEEQNMLP